jgi:hypothetical protein
MIALHGTAHHVETIALGLLAESFPKLGPDALNGGERNHIVVHVDADVLQAREGGRCELDDGPPSLSRRRAVCPVTRAWSGSSRTATVSRSTSAAGREPSRRHRAAR